MKDLTLTFAELAFLMRYHAEDAAESLQRLGLPDLTDDDRVLSAGFASLVARDLLRADAEDQAIGDPVLASIAMGLDRPAVRVSAGRISAEGEFSVLVQYCESTLGRMLVAPVGSLCYEMRGVAEGVPAMALVADVVERSAGVGEGIALHLETADIDETILLKREEDNSFVVATSTSTSEESVRLEAGELTGWLTAQSDPEAEPAV